MTGDTGFSELDRHFAQLMGRLATKSGPELELAARLVSQSRGEGHVCLAIRERAGKPLPAEMGGGRAPEEAAWIEELRASGIVGVPGDFAPLILDGQDRLYLRRYWEYESRLAEVILGRVTGPQPRIDAAVLRKSLDRFFPEPDPADRQRLAAGAAVMSNFCVISGGPGTGKTRTVAILLALLIEQAGGERCRIALAAPTGKAAARLKESIRDACGSVPGLEEFRGRLPDDATTIHRLLGTIPHSPYFRHDARHPLAVDALIVDEASMVDLALMAKLFDAVPPAARIILLGDKDQLASVEAGYVLGDICNTGETIEPSHEFAVRYREATGTDTGISAAPRQVAIQDFIIELRKSYRFRAGSGISRLSTAINAGDGVAALGVLGDANGAARRRLPAAGALPRALRVRAIERYRFFLEEADPAERLKRFGLFRVLCAVRRGPYGVVNLNGLIAQALEDAGILSRHGMPWYAGRPVMVTQNDYGLKLYNGDIGIALPDAAACGELRVFFLSADGELRRLLPSRIPAHETAFAMTVHKSQGSEFDHVLLILPDEDVPVLTRELLYTAVTRARESMEIWCGESVLRSALARQQTRTSGLREALWGDRSGAAKPGM